MCFLWCVCRVVGVSKRCHGRSECVWHDRSEESLRTCVWPWGARGCGSTERGAREEGKRKLVAWWCQMPNITCQHLHIYNASLISMCLRWHYRSQAP